MTVTWSIDFLCRGAERGEYSRIASKSPPDCLIRQFTINDIHDFAVTASVVLPTMRIEIERYGTEIERETDDEYTVVTVLLKAKQPLGRYLCV